jgi:hypothetical protein
VQERDIPLLRGTPLPDGVADFQALMNHPDISSSLSSCGAAIIRGFGARVHPRVHAVSSSSSTMVEFLGKLDPGLPLRRVRVHAIVSPSPSRLAISCSLSHPLPPLTPHPSAQRFHRGIGCKQGSPCLVMDPGCMAHTEEQQLRRAYARPGPVLDAGEEEVGGAVGRGAGAGAATAPPAADAEAAAAPASSSSSSAPRVQGHMTRQRSAAAASAAGSSSSSSSSSPSGGWDWDHLVRNVLPSEVLLYASDVDNISVLSYERRKRVGARFVELAPRAGAEAEGEGEGAAATASSSSAAAASSSSSSAAAAAPSCDDHTETEMAGTGAPPAPLNSSSSSSSSSPPDDPLVRLDMTRITPSDCLFRAVMSNRGLTSPGMTSPYTYFGRAYSAFAAHGEDHNLPSLNLLVFGAPKVWYVVPTQHFARATELIRSSVYRTEIPACAHAVAHKLQLPSLALLRSVGIPVTRLVQRAGDLVITAPGAIHWGINCGDNIAESTNVADASWITSGALGTYDALGPCTCLDKNPWSLIPRGFLPLSFVRGRLRLAAKRVRGGEPVGSALAAALVYLDEEGGTGDGDGEGDGEGAAAHDAAAQRGGKRKRVALESGSSASSDCRVDTTACSAPSASAPAASPEGSSPTNGSSQLAGGGAEADAGGEGSGKRVKEASAAPLGDEETVVVNG